MASYETTFVVHSKLSQQDALKVVDQLLESIQKHQGSIIKREYWGLLDLAYPIKKTHKAHYFYVGFESSVAGKFELDRLLGINEDVIRSLTVRLEKISKEQTPMMQQRERADQPGGFSDNRRGGFERGERRNHYYRPQADDNDDASSLDADDLE